MREIKVQVDLQLYDTYNTLEIDFLPWTLQTFSAARGSYGSPIEGKVFDKAVENISRQNSTNKKMATVRRNSQ